MATNRSSGVTSSNSLMTSGAFTGGLNTELSGIVDSADFTKDELNMMIRQDNCRSRRPGVDYEELYKFNTQVLKDTDDLTAFNAIEWYDINSPDEAETYTQTPYIVVQAGSKLLFYKNNGQPYSGNQMDFTLDLTQYAIDNNPNSPNYKDPSKYRCKFAIAYGCLFIASEAIRPIRLRSAQEEVLPDFAITYPFCQVSMTGHQGRRQRYGTRDDRPNSRAYVKIYFDNVLVLNYDVPVDPNIHEPRTNPVPNSFTIAAAFNARPQAVRRNITAEPHAQNATELMWNYGKDGKTRDLVWGPEDWITFKGSTTAVRGLKITIEVCGWDQKHKGRWSKKVKSYTAYMTGGSSEYHNTGDLNLQIRDTSRGAQDLLSIDENPSKMSYAHLYNLINQGWTTELIGKFYVKSGDIEERRFFPGNNLAQQYLKDSKTAEFKPEALLNTTFGNTPAARGHIKLDYFNQDRNSTASLSTSMLELVAAINKALVNAGETGDKTLDDILDLNFPISPRNPQKQVPIVKPKVNYVADLISYAGRIFYLTGCTLLYSQTIAEDISKVDQCYTDADPTSEELSDVIETDGGLISLPDLGEGLKLSQVGSYLLAFGTRANVAITGTANNIFTATAYSAGALNSVPTQAPDSFVETEYGLFYWGTTCIEAILPGDGGLSVQDISTPSIMTWYGKLTNLQQKYCKGVYSSSKKKIYWFYPSDTEKPKRLDCALVYDIQRGAFAPQKVATGAIDEDTGEFEELNTPEIVSGLVLKVPFRSNKEYPIIATAGSYTDAYGYIDSSNNRYYITKSYIEKNLPVYTINSNNLVSYSTIAKCYLIRDPQTNELIRSTMVFPSDTTTTYYGYSVTQNDVTSIYYTTSLTAAENDPVYIVDEDGVINVSDFVVSSCSATTLAFDDSGSTVTCLRDSLNPQHDVTAPVMIWASRDNSTYDTRVNPLTEADKYYEVVDEADIKILADKPIESEEFTYESSILLCYDPVNMKVTFGDFRNNLLRDWTAGDYEGDGYFYDSYLISHPMNSASYTNFTGKRQTNLVNNKNLPYLITYFRRTEVGPTTNGSYVYPSKCQGSVLWDWRTSGEKGKWSNPTDLYRPHKDTIFENGFIINKTNIRGLGRSYQLKLESIDDNQFIIEGLVYDLKNDGRI